MTRGDAARHPVAPRPCMNYCYRMPSDIQMRDAVLRLEEDEYGVLRDPPEALREKVNDLTVLIVGLVERLPGPLNRRPRE